MDKRYMLLYAGYKCRTVEQRYKLVSDAYKLVSDAYSVHFIITNKLISDCHV
jgi:hypothetical protein